MIFLGSDADRANASGHIVACIRSSRPLTNDTEIVITYTSGAGVEENLTVIMGVGESKINVVIDLGEGNVSEIVQLNVTVPGGSTGVTTETQITVGSKLAILQWNLC